MLGAFRRMRQDTQAVGSRFGFVPQDDRVRDGQTQTMSSAAPSIGWDSERCLGIETGEFDFWNLETGECLATLKGHTGIVTSVQITPDGRFAVSGSE